MEEFLVFAEEHIPTIILYALTVIIYVLYLIISVTSSKRGKFLTNLFKEKSQKIDETDTALRNDMRVELDAAKKAYDDAVNEIVSLKTRLDNAEKALQDYLGGKREVENDDIIE